MVTIETEQKAAKFLAMNLGSYDREVGAEPVQITLGYRQFVSLLAKAMASAATESRLLTEAKLKP